jgi:hypothetical protein
MSHVRKMKYSNKYNPLPDSIRSPRKSIDAINIHNLSCVLHTQEKLVNNICQYIYIKITISHNTSSSSYITHNRNKIIMYHNRITCTQVSSKNKSIKVCSVERDVTYIHNISSKIWFILSVFPSVSR